jgi:hypothetical protein
LAGSVAEPAMFPGAGGMIWPRMLEFTDAPKALPETNFTSASADRDRKKMLLETRSVTPTSARRWAGPQLCTARFVGRSQYEAPVDLRLRSDRRRLGQRFLTACPLSLRFPS